MFNSKFKSFLKDDDSEKEKQIEVESSEEPTLKNDWLDEPEGQLTVDVFQTPQEIIIKSAVAGVKQEDLDIAISGDMITVKGSRELEETVKNEDYFYQECYWGKFSRSIILPTEVDADRAVASLKNGILTIRLPKIDKAKIKKVKIKGD